MRQALFAGSFDPFTMGHLDTAAQAAAMFDKLTVAVAVNAGKGKGLFNAEDRAAFAKASVAHLPNVSVITCGQEYVVNLAERMGCLWLVRGLPNFADFGYEYDLFHLNRETNSRIQTVFFMCDKAGQQIRSSNIRAQFGLRHWPRFVRNHVPEPVLRSMVEIDARRRWTESFPHMVQVFDEVLIPAYSKRAYHDFRHVLHVLDMAEEFKWTVPVPALKLAAWFHDFVADSDSEFTGNMPRGTVERLSAEKAVSVIHDSPESCYAEDVYALIMATAPGNPTPGENAALFRCIDWSALAFPAVEYDDYARRVREEYLGNNKEAVWFKGRMRFLESTLERAKSRGLFCESRVFTAHPAWERAESTAIDNIQREIKALRD